MALMSLSWAELPAGAAPPGETLVEAPESPYVVLPVLLGSEVEYGRVRKGVAGADEHKTSIL